MEFIRNSKIINKKYWEFFIPTILMVMGGSLMVLVDGIIVSNILGIDEFAAINCTLPISQAFGMIAVLLGTGTSVVISIARGRRETEKVNKFFSAMLILLLVFAVMFMVPQLCATDFFCSLLTSNEVLYPLVYDYYSTLLWAAPVWLFMLSMEYILRVEGKPRLATGISISSHIINLTLDVVFMGLLHMGIKGAALATIVGFGFGGVAIFCSLAFGKRTLCLSFGKLSGCIGEIVKTGIPAALGTGLIAVELLFLNNIVMNTAGNKGMIAFSVCMSALSLGSMFVGACAQTMMPILGIYYGENDFAGLRMILKRTFRILLVCTITLFLFLEVFPGAFLNMYGITAAKEVAMVVPALRIYAVSLLGMSISTVMQYYYMTIEKQQLANIITLINGLVGIVPCAYIMSKVAGITGVWWAFSISQLVSILFIFVVAKGNFSNIYQMKEEPAILDISLLGKENQGAEASRQVMEFLGNYEMDKKKLNKIGVATEEMIENIYQYSQGKEVHIDLRLKAEKEGFMLSFCDDGLEFDPTTYQPEEKESYAIDSIMMLKAISKEMDYQRVIGLNKTNIFF